MQEVITRWMNLVGSIGTQGKLTIEPAYKS